MNRHLVCSWAALSVLFLAVTASAQTAEKKPQIRLSEEPAGRAAASDAADAPKGETDEAEGAKESATESGSEAPEKSEDGVLPETPESEVGAQPAPGYGPAKPVKEKEPGEDLPKSAAQSEPRVIDISDEDEEPAPLLEPMVPADQLPFTYHMNHYDVVGGFRIVGTPNDGLEPFLVDPVMADAFLRAGVALGVAGRFAAAAQLEYGIAEVTANVRSLDSRLHKDHLTLGLEGRYHIMHRLFAFARLAPGIEAVNAAYGNDDTTEFLVSDDDFPGSMAFTLDSSLGAALRVFGASDGREREPRLWLLTEGGYRYSGKHELTLAPDVAAPPRATSVTLDPLSFSGGFWTLGMLATF